MDSRSQRGQILIESLIALITLTMILSLLIRAGDIGRITLKETQWIKLSKN